VQLEVVEYTIDYANKNLIASSHEDLVKYIVWHEQGTLPNIILSEDTPLVKTVIMMR
jgi:glutaredoxin